MQGLTLLQEAVQNTRRPLSWMIGDDGSVSKYDPSQRDLKDRRSACGRRTWPSRPRSVIAPLSKDLLGKKRV